MTWKVIIECHDTLSSVNQVPRKHGMMSVYYIGQNKIKDDVLSNKKVQTFSISATFCSRPSSSLRMAAACSSDESNYDYKTVKCSRHDENLALWVLSKITWSLTCKALNRSWCSNFLTPRICWNRSYNCSFDRANSLCKLWFNWACCCCWDLGPPGRLDSSSPTPGK